jgi:hypothetical protein
MPHNELEARHSERALPISPVNAISTQIVIPTVYVKQCESSELLQEHRAQGHEGTLRAVWAAGAATSAPKLHKADYVKWAVHRINPHRANLSSSPTFRTLFELGKPFMMCQVEFARNNEWWKAS